MKKFSKNKQIERCNIIMPSDFNDTFGIKDVKRLQLSKEEVEKSLENQDFRKKFEEIKEKIRTHNTLFEIGQPSGSGISTEVGEMKRKEEIFEDTIKNGTEEIDTWFKEWIKNEKNEKGKLIK